MKYGDQVLGHYGYVLGDPVNLVDPNGLYSTRVWNPAHTVRQSTVYQFAKNLAQLKGWVDDPGLTQAGPQHDKYHHCVANCQSRHDTLPGGQVAAWALDTAKEDIYDACVSRSDPEDWDANYQGQYLGTLPSSGGSCAARCAGAYPSSGH